MGLKAGYDDVQPFKFHFSTPERVRDESYSWSVP